MRLEPGPGRTSGRVVSPRWQLGTIAMQLLQKTQKTPVSSLSWGTIRDPGLSPVDPGNADCAIRLATTPIAGSHTFRILSESSAVFLLPLIVQWSRHNVGIASRSTRLIEADNTLSCFAHHSHRVTTGRPGFQSQAPLYRVSSQLRRYISPISRTI